MNLPSLNPQPYSESEPGKRAAAMDRAAEIRRARAELKDALKSGRVTLASVLEDAETTDIIGKLKVSAVLQALPGVGKIRATQIMEKLKIADSRRLRGLGDQQKKALLAEFGSGSVGTKQGDESAGRSVGRAGSRTQNSRTDLNRPSRIGSRDAASGDSSGYVLSGVQSQGDTRLTIAVAAPTGQVQQIVEQSERFSSLTTVTHIGVDVYLATDDPSVAESILAAVDRLADTLGFDGPYNVEVFKGSIFRRSIARTKKVLTSDEVVGRLKKVEHAVELSYLGLKQAEFDNLETQAVSQLIGSLVDVPQACVRVGSIFLVKYEGPQGPVVIVRNLSPLEIRAIEQYPEIQTNPKTAFESLSTAIASFEPEQSSKPAIA